MNLESASQPPDRQQVADKLRQFRPAHAELDSSRMFYEAGFRAAQSQRVDRGPRLGQMLAAALLAAFVAGPAGYLAGNSSSVTTGINQTAARSTEDPASLSRTGDPDASSTAAEDQEERASFTPTEPASAEAPSSEPAKPQRKSVGKSRLFALWSSPLAGRPRFDAATASLAAFHASYAGSNPSEPHWPDFSVENQAWLHRDARIRGGDAPATSTSATLAVGNAVEWVETLETVK